MAEQEQKTTELIIPKHIAIIPDGNRRWAKERGLPTLLGHKKGFDTANDVISHSRKLGVHTMTLWAFSTENWNRSKDEVDYLMKLYEENIEENLRRALKEDVRIYHLGRKDRIPTSLREKIEKAETQTKDCKSFVLNIALDYGGHDDILRATQKIIADVQAGVLKAEDVSEVIGAYNGKYPYFRYKNYLDTADQPNPYPDLVVRTSGERRFSGFLSWQIAYSEFYFPPVYMPDFTPAELDKAIADFNNRERRFGGNAK